MDAEIEELPADYVLAWTFGIAKTSKGGYADYFHLAWAFFLNVLF
jgi:hypothetical protein